MKKPANNLPFSIGAVLIIIFLEIVFYISRLPLIIPFLFLLGAIYLSYQKKGSLKLFLNMGLLLALLLFTTRVFPFYGMSPFYIPAAGVVMLVMLLYNDLQLTLLMSVVSSLMVGLVLGNLEATAVFFIGSLTVAYRLKDARTRGRLIEAGFLIGMAGVLTVILLHPSWDMIGSKRFLTVYFQPLMINGFIVAALVMGTLKAFEWVFGCLTNFSLLELSDFNHSLLKRLIMEAPGTYHHSLVVSNISEAAADTIGANSLLARVGAYYHDIGKMVKPHYFTENQLLEGSKHDNLEPSMSRLVILNHVKEGMELARQYKLHPRIIEFIPEHHGTSLIHFFYQRALEEAGPEEKVDQQNFRYPGPKPQSRETAIVMMADSAEGSVRALDEPIPARIDETVRKVINNKFIDGQLDECTITLKDLDQISATFSRVLSAMYHSRVKYPEKKNDNGHNGSKFTEAHSDQNPPSQKDRPKSS